MKAQELKRKAQVAEWKEKVAECRSSGETVKEWCQARGIAIKTYYYWEKEVLAEAENAKEQAAEGRRCRGNFVAVPALLGGNTSGNGCKGADGRRGNRNLWWSGSRNHRTAAEGAERC